MVTGIPFYTAHDGSTPVRYFRLGRFTLGNSHGFYPSHGVEYAQQLLYPIPAVWELLAYDIRNGASCTFYELVEAVSVTSLQPWDRTMLPIVQAAQVQIPGGTGVTTSFSYTVPVARKLWVSSAYVGVRRITANTANVGPTSNIRINGSLAWMAQLFSNVVGSETWRDSSSAAVILKAGDVIAGEYSNPDTGGMVHSDARVVGFLFDA